MSKYKIIFDALLDQNTTDRLSSIALDFDIPVLSEDSLFTEFTDDITDAIFFITRSRKHSMASKSPFVFVSPQWLLDSQEDDTLYNYKLYQYQGPEELQFLRSTTIIIFGQPSLYPTTQIKTFLINHGASIQDPTSSPLLLYNSPATELIKEQQKIIAVICKKISKKESQEAHKLLMTDRYLRSTTTTTTTIQDGSNNNNSSSNNNRMGSGTVTTVTCKIDFVQECWVTHFIENGLPPSNMYSYRPKMVTTKKVK